MKIKLSFLLVISLIVVPFTFASFWDWITGRSIEQTSLTEQVKCVFANSNSEQKCYTDDGKFACSGIGTCIVDVSGESKTLGWKSSCGGYASTTIDGNNEEIEFKCEQTPIPATPAPAEIVKEQVKCVFVNSDAIQKCYSGDGKFSCSGIGSCVADVSGEKGLTLAWKSSCGGYAYTAIDGQDESVEFKCETPVTQPIAPTPVEVIKEQVKCIFANSNSEQKCYGENFGCSGIGTCIAEVSGEKGKQIIWKSSCGGYAYTVVDGNNDYAEFKCEQATTPIPIPIEVIKEQVKCVFANSDSIQKCYTDNGKFGCSSTGTCIADVAGEKGSKLTWKSTCGGYAYSVIDGQNDYAEFKCESSIPAEIVKEQVKCIFANSNSEQKCYGENFWCSGIGTCVAEVSGEKGKMLTWKSTCGGYAYTIIDGNNEYAEFKCEQLQTIPVDKTKFKLNFFYWKECQLCESEKVFLEQLKQKYPQAIYEYFDASQGINEGVIAYLNLKRGLPTVILDDKIWTGYNEATAAEIENKMKYCIEQGCSVIPKPMTRFLTQPPRLAPMPGTLPTCSDSDGLNYFLKGYVDSNNLIKYDTCRFMNSELEYNDTYECSGDKCYVLESSCTPSNTAQAQVWKCPNGCRDGACIKGEVKEQVRCIFTDPELIQRCYADFGKLGCSDLIRKCYSENFECHDITVASTPTDSGFKYMPFCIAEVSGELGTKLIWKSSCGGYGYTVIDGNNEDIEFTCVPSSNVTPEQISGKGFLRAYWQCYDGTEEKSIEGVDMTTCKSSEIWQEYAKEFCKDRCYPDRSKCGVNSFSVMDECYIEVGKEGVIFTPKIGGKKFAMPPDSKIGDIMVVYFYSDSCRYCSGMNEELDKVTKELNIDIKRVNVVSDLDLAESYGIKGVPAFLVLRYESDGIKEFLRYGKADSNAIINWINKPETPGKPTEIEKFKEEILICKDSCPLNGKCYPFGFRKEKKYCSDEGAFKEQLKEESACENNFECQSNVCIDDKCISGSLMRKVVDWFKKLFS